MANWATQKMVPSQNRTFNLKPFNPDRNLFVSQKFSFLPSNCHEFQRCSRVPNMVPIWSRYGPNMVSNMVPIWSNMVFHRWRLGKKLLNLNQKITFIDQFLPFSCTNNGFLPRFYTNFTLFISKYEPTYNRSLNFWTPNVSLFHYFQHSTSWTSQNFNSQSRLPTSQRKSACCTF